MMSCTSKPFNMSRSSAFSCGVLQFLFNAAEFLIRPYLLCLTALGRPFLPVTPELQNPWRLRFQKILGVPLLCIFLAICFVPMLCGFCLRNILHNVRRPYCLSVKVPLNSSNTSTSKSVFTVATANLCLLPELMARYNNLNRTWQRAKEIGQRIVIDQTYYTGMMEKKLKQSGKHIKKSDKSRCQTMSKEHQSKGDNSDSSVDLNIDIITHFPRTDFLCLQETFDRDYTKGLISEIHKVYPYIVYDVGYCGARRNLYGLNSGLMFASQYQILDVRFEPFSKKCGFCRITGKGLLMVKVVIFHFHTCFLFVKYKHH